MSHPGFLRSISDDTPGAKTDAVWLSYLSDDDYDDDAVSIINSHNEGKSFN